MSTKEHDFGDFAAHWRLSGPLVAPKTGRQDPSLRYPDAETLMLACVEYFEWNLEHPIKVQKLFSTKTGVVRATVDQLRAPTVGALCLRLGVSHADFNYWRDMCPIRRDVVVWAHEVLRTWKIEAAAADLINPMIASRLTGLSEKSEVSGPNGGPIQTSEISPRELLADRLTRLAAAYGPASVHRQSE